MKALIWILSCFIFSILNVILGEITGIRVGSVLFYVIWYYSARAMCKAWDKHRIIKKAEKAGVSAFAQIKSEIPTAVLADCETSRGKYDELKEKLKGYAKEKQISRASADIILDEYMHARKVVTEEPVITTAEKNVKADQIRFCRKCGEKLIDGSRFCRKCGTEVVEMPQ